MLKQPHRPVLAFFLALFAALGVVVVFRLHELQLQDKGHYQERAQSQHARRVVLQPERGDILDRNGAALARSVGRLSVYVHPVYLRPPHAELDLDRLATQLSFYTGLTRGELRERFDRDRPVPLARALREDEAQRIIGLLEMYDLDGRAFWFHRESRRVYPRPLAAQAVGFCARGGDGDNTGLAGVEIAFDSVLAGRRVEGRVARTGIRQALEPVPERDVLASRGNTLVLTIDAGIQEAAEGALAEAVEKWAARGACAVAVDVETGEVLALASYPTFDNNSFETATAEQRRNRAITDPLEAGSVIKLFTAAMLIDQDLVTPATLVDCEGGRAVIDRRRITDAPGHDPLHVVPFRVALAFSSNVGIIKPALMMENEPWHRYLASFGFGRDSSLELGGESGGILHPVERWTRLSRTSLPMGYEISVTPLQVALGVAALVNDGRLMRPRIVREVRSASGEVLERFEPEVLQRPIRPTTSAIMRELMQDVVMDGTGKKARIPGYLIGGKTGTTVKSHIRDRKEYIAGFAGVVPIDRPRVAIYVCVDAPTKARFGGTIAAPAFARIARAAMIQLGVPPSEAAPAEDADLLEVEPEFDLPSPLFARAAEGTMPDLRGLTAAAARRAVPAGPASLKLVGTGIVTDQSPAPGEPVDPSTDIFLHFEPLSTSAAVEALRLANATLAAPSGE
ncbi:MAG: penicillin-binding transpeptidase domain-containing protein [Candidatus Sumerlaeia bacterium]|nr:penicillin-binding transpeptidase domain-containing protein [Candidatus Sumerlaeia bacterium]